MAGNSLPKWNLNDIYPDFQTSEEILNGGLGESLKLCKQKSEEFCKVHKTKVESLSSVELFNAIKQYESISQTLGRISTYAYLKYSTNLNNADITAFYQKISEELALISGVLLFFELEINSISDDKMDSMLRCDKLSHYGPYLINIRRFKKYQLEEKLEKLFLEKSITSRMAWVRLYDETLSGLSFNINGESVNATKALNMLSSSNRGTRKIAAKEIGRVFKENSKTFTFITNILAKDKSIEDSWRNFAHPSHSRHLANNIEPEVVQALQATVRKNYQNISHRYYKLKAKILGLQRLHYSDRNAPITLSDTSYSWEETKEIVLTAYSKFSTEFAGLASQFFVNPWIDAATYDGKDSGAYSHPCTPCVHPYIMTNFLGKARDVATVAHEVGHGVHQILSAKNGYLMSETPLTVAETASVFGEQLVFRELLNRQKSPQEKAAIIAGKIDDMINTVIRQIAFYTFETKVHEMRQKQELSCDDICKIWLEIQKESLGDIFDFEEEYYYYWSYISHFVHAPFYVYAYAFGDCLVNSLYQIYLNENISNFPEKYIKMLSKAGTQHHKLLLSPFEIDITTESFWQNGINLLSGLIDELELLWESKASSGQH